MFKNTDHDALFKIWPKIEKKPFEKFQIKLDRLVDAYHRDEVSHSMLTFVKLFSTHKYKFERSVESLIVFCDVSLIQICKEWSQTTNFLIELTKHGFSLFVTNHIHLFEMIWNEQMSSGFCLCDLVWLFIALLW